MDNTEANKPEVKQEPVTASNTPESNNQEASPVQIRKDVGAFVRMRQEKAALKRELASLKASQAKGVEVAKIEPKVEQETVIPEAKPVVTSQAKVELAPQATVEAGHTEEVVNAAIIEASKDKDIASVPGGIIEVLDLMDNDPKLVRLYDIDPALALREATSLWKSKLGIDSSTKVMPVPVKVSGGVSQGKEDLASLFTKLESTKPGSKAYRELVNKVNLAMRG